MTSTLEVRLVQFLVYGIIIGFIAFLVVLSRKERRRRKEVGETATRLGLLPWGKTVMFPDLRPEDALGKLQGISNAYGGTINAVPVAVFDVEKKMGKGSTPLTVIAIRAPSNVFGTDSFDPELKTIVSGEWRYMHRPFVLSFPGKRLSAAQVEMLLQRIRKTEEAP